MKQRASQHHMDTLAALLLFGVFAVCVLLVLLTGADAYRRITDRDRLAYDRRTSEQYIATRVRQADGAGCVTVEDFGGVEALTLWDGDYVTRIYCCDGYLMELYSEWDLEMSSGDGEKVMAVDAMDLDLTGGLLTVTLENGGERDRFCLSLRSGAALRMTGEGGAA